jgi:hypothetical protein
MLKRLWNENLQGKPNKTRPSATLSTTNPTRLYLGSNPGGRGAKRAANRLTRPTALKTTIRYIVTGAVVVFY